MSFLFSNVDANLQAELNARGLSGFQRSPRDLAFMLEKIANVELIAYNSGSISPNNEIARIGGDQLLEGRYLPTGPDGFLNDSKTYNVDGINFNTETGKYEKKMSSPIDSSRKIGPFITSVDVTTADNSLGGQNTATINITVPNPSRDLDTMEDIWLRPGRYISLTIKHPNSAIVSWPETGGLLTEKALPNKKALQKKYPDWKIDDTVMNSLKQMNEFIFEGLIVNFELSYQPSGQIDITLSVRGTSNTFADIGLWMPKDSENKKETTPQKNTDLIIDQPLVAGQVTVPEPPTTAPLVNPTSNFFATLYKLVDDSIKDATGESTPNSIGCIDFNTGKGAPYPNTDHYIVFGEPYPSSTVTNINTKFSRYITLGALIRFINDYPMSNMKTILPSAEIMCDDLQCGSNHYDYLTSCTPKDILFLPENTNNKGDMNWYGELAYYQKLSDPSNRPGPWKQKPKWPGIDAHMVPGTSTSLMAMRKYLHSSKILINMETIQDIILGSIDKASGNRQYGLASANKSTFTVKSLMASISNKISYASGGSMKMALMTHPADDNKLLFADTKYLKAQINTKESVDEIITGYSIPMFANHPSGTVIRDFKLQSSVPDSVKSLMYVANGSTDISEQDVAPYMNYMYNSKNPDALNKLAADYSAKHTAAIQNIINTKTKFSTAPELSENITSLHQALTEYFKYPTNEIKKSNKMAAPIFPFSAEFTIDGINGFRYGDQLIFACLPTNYQINTLFSIMQITQTVGSSGDWTTAIRCVMRTDIS